MMNFSGSKKKKKKKYLYFYKAAVLKIKGGENSPPHFLLYVIL